MDTIRHEQYDAHIAESSRGKSFSGTIFSMVNNYFGVSFVLRESCAYAQAAPHRAVLVAATSLYSLT